MDIRKYAVPRQQLPGLEELASIHSGSSASTVGKRGKETAKLSDAERVEIGFVALSLPCVYS